MKKHFYSHLVKIDEVVTNLDTLDLTVEERQELTVIAESSIHHVVVDVVLSELSGKDKKLFLSYIASHDHDKTWSLLTEKIANVEDKIKQSVEILKKQMHEDIHEAKNK